MWYQHSSYAIYTQDGRLIERELNTVGHYAQTPRMVTLAAGRYVVRAQAKGDFEVEVPVIIQPGRTTVVHLDGKWQPPAFVSKSDVISLPNGTPVGWSADSTKG